MTNTNDRSCAVVGCTAEGKPHRCPHDGTFHGHGRVHYNGPPTSSLTFRGDGWYLICDEHYEHVAKERRAWEQGKAVRS
ncbi:MAG TPA: hypothetical protein VFD36_29350 [Kofleriaceae bacterium]|nr:hypothetical protein [Kofleriaceae bacterium]